MDQTGLPGDVSSPASSKTTGGDMVASLLLHHRRRRRRRLDSLAEISHVIDG